MTLNEATRVAECERKDDFAAPKPKGPQTSFQLCIAELDRVIEESFRSSTSEQVCEVLRTRITSIRRRQFMVEATGVGAVKMKPMCCHCGSLLSEPAIEVTVKNVTNFHDPKQESYSFTLSNNPWMEKSSAKETKESSTHRPELPKSPAPSTNQNGVEKCRSARSPSVVMVGSVPATRSESISDGANWMRNSYRSPESTREIYRHSPSPWDGALDYRGRPFRSRPYRSRPFRSRGSWDPRYVYYRSRSPDRRTASRDRSSSPHPRSPSRRRSPNSEHISVWRSRSSRGRFSYSRGRPYSAHRRSPSPSWHSTLMEERSHSTERRSSRGRSRSPLICMDGQRVPATITKTRSYSSKQSAHTKSVEKSSEKSRLDSPGPEGIAPELHSELRKRADSNKEIKRIPVEKSNGRPKEKIELGKEATTAGSANSNDPRLNSGLRIKRTPHRLGSEKKKKESVD